MAVKVDITIDERMVEGLETAILAALADTAEAVLKDIQSAAVVPFDQGLLQGSSFATDAELTEDGAEARVVFDTPYARRLYFSEGYNFQKVRHANAQDHWMQEYTDEGDNAQWVADTFKKHLEEQLK